MDKKSSRVEKASKKWLVELAGTHQYWKCEDTIVINQRTVRKSIFWKQIQQKVRMSVPSKPLPLLLLLCCFLPLVRPGYIDCVPGTLNVILSAPHGGYEKPAGIPDRKAGCWVDNECVYSHNCARVDSKKCRVSTIRDGYTKELTLLIADELEVLTNKRPYVVINNLYRGKMDANREIDEATFGDPIAAEAYQEYHQCIVDARREIGQDDSVQNRGLFVDIHGQGHPNNRAELGYLFSKTTLNSNNDLEASLSSIRGVSSRSSLPFDTLLRGRLSFGYFLEQEGYNAVPSPGHPKPGSEKYFSGGYNTKNYGSRSDGMIDAIQIESSREQRATGAREAYAVALARTIVNFMEAHY